MERGLAQGREEEREEGFQMDNVWHKAVWVKGRRKTTGKWLYYWSGNRFLIRLDKRDEITGNKREFFVCGYEPNFNGWEKK